MAFIGYFMCTPIFNDYQFSLANLKKRLQDNYYPASAKINFFLNINERNNNGYHNLQSLFLLLDFGDWVKIETNNNGCINFKSNNPSLDNPQNLVIKAATDLRDFSEKNSNNSNKNRLGADLFLDKFIPAGGGLGGGSSDAATVLLTLNRLWNLNYDLATLAKIGLKIGADIPFFIFGQSAIAQGLGEKLSAIEIDKYLTQKYFIIIKPNCEISTASIFQHPDLTRNTPYKSIVNLMQSEFKNDCQKIVTKLYPDIEFILQQLLKYAPSRLSGTGACVFAHCDEKIGRQIITSMQLLEHASTKYNFMVATYAMQKSPLHKILSYDYIPQLN